MPDEVIAVTTADGVVAPTTSERPNRPTIGFLGAATPQIWGAYVKAFEVPPAITRRATIVQ